MRPDTLSYICLATHGILISLQILKDPCEIFKSHLIHLWKSMKCFCVHCTASVFNEFIQNRVIGSRKVLGESRNVIINFVMNSAGPPRTLDSISALRVAMRRATPFVYLDLREPRVETRLWKRVAIPQVIVSNKELQPIATMHCQ